VKGQFPHLIVEASGGVALDTIKEYFGPHIDVISLSLTTQGYSTVDFSFKIQKEGKNPLIFHSRSRRKEKIPRILWLSCEIALKRMLFGTPVSLCHH
jgi:hypothetical protein